jgi:hypothetical protein
MNYESSENELKLNWKLIKSELEMNYESSENELKFN